MSMKALFLVAACGTILALAPSLDIPLLSLDCAAYAQDGETNPAEKIRDLMNQAKKLGGKGQLPHTWWSLDSRIDAAEENGAREEEWALLEIEARRLVNASAFIEKMRSQKSGMEALLSRFDQALIEIGTLYGVRMDPVLSGTDLSKDLIAKLNADNLSRQILVDSLTVANRRFNESMGGRAAAQESLITVLEVEVSSLRRQLWETELRVGVAEADRSAAESVLTRKQDREEAIAALRALIPVEQGEVLITSKGEIVMQVYGISFGVGSASLAGGQDALVENIAAAIGMFPTADVRVEGHTDDTGSNDANLRLSRRRAETMARLLERKTGRPAESFGTEGFGPDRPIALNSTPEGRAMNRRIDVVLGATP